jgi:hypothetical protein
VSPPFGSPLLRTSPIGPMTSTPPTICLLDYFVLLRCSFRIPNTSIYMSFRVAQDHNKATGRDTTSSMTSSTRHEDPTATMWCIVVVLLSLVVVSFLVSLVVNYSLIVVELVLLLLIVNYVVDLMMCVTLVLCMIYPICSTHFGGSPSREAAKIGSDKK